MLLLLISFVAGVLTVLAPCILPLLPVIVGGSLSGGGINKGKALTIIISLGVSVILFTLLLKVSTLFINIPQSLWTWISGGLITFIGLTIIFPSLWEGEFMARLNARANIILGRGEMKHSFWGDVIIGASLGPVFSTCSPTYFIILATVLPVSPITGMVYLLTYTIGLCLMLFVIAVIGQKIMQKLNIASDPHSYVRKVFGILFVIVGLAVITGADAKLQTSIAGGVFDVTTLEQKLLALQTGGSGLPLSTGAPSFASTTPEDVQKIIEAKSKKYPLAPEITNPSGFINTGGMPITLTQFKGKNVVLIDIWTYSCINCVRTIPQIESWYKKYKDLGLVVVGVHTPEFSFEKVQSNVAAATARLGITYPVVMDNDYGTWNAFGNQYWPRQYLIDMDGYIVYDHIGEGGDVETEKAIQSALQERAMRLNTGEKVSTDTMPVVDAPTDVQSPETYFGSNRNEYLANGNQGKDGVQNLTLPSSVSPNSLYLGGTWDFSPEYAENQGPAEIVFGYFAKNVYIVASADKPIEVAVYQDGKFLKTVTVQGDELYTLIEGDSSGQHLLELKIPQAGLKAFTFTFG